MRKKILALCVLLATFQVPANANNCLCDDFTVGVDFLYWSPCFSDHHYAFKNRNGGIGSSDQNVKYKYLGCNWEPGFRVFAAKEGLCGYDVGIAYTRICADECNSVSSDIERSISLSIGEPTGNLRGDYASSHWDFTYQTLEAVVALPFSMDHGCFALEAYTGIQGLKFTQERKDYIEQNLGSEQNYYATFKRDQDFWGIGPMFGVRYSYDAFCNFKFFGNMNVNLSIGNNDLKDHYVRKRVDDDVTVTHNHYKYNDECVCFPGIHWTSGISYDTCLCGSELTFAVGYEYVNWFNVPQFHYYEESADGVISSARNDNIVFQGFFVRAAMSF